MLESLRGAGVENFTMRAAVPGTEVPGHEVSSAIRTVGCRTFPDLLSEFTLLKRLKRLCERSNPVSWAFLSLV